MEAASADDSENEADSSDDLSYNKDICVNLLDKFSKYYSSNQCPDTEASRYIKKNAYSNASTAVAYLKEGININNYSRILQPLVGESIFKKIEEFIRKGKCDLLNGLYGA